MLGGSCASAAGAIEGVVRPAMLIIAAVKAKIARLILVVRVTLVFGFILIVSLIAIAAFIFTPRKIAGIWLCPLPQDTISVLRAAQKVAPVPYNRQLQGEKGYRAPHRAE